MTKKYHYLYKITNNLNGKIYIGVHATDNMDDGYMGSGKLIWLALKKYGKANFTKEILQTFDSVQAMYEAESVIVNIAFVKDDNTYNITTGGKCGLECHSEKTKGKIRNIILGYKQTPEHRQASAAGLKKYFAEHTNWHTGVKLSAEHKRKISIGHMGSANGNYGKRWISNNEQQISTFILKTEELPEGWVLGRNNWKTLHHRHVVQDRLIAKELYSKEKPNRDKTEAERLFALYIEHKFPTLMAFTKSEFCTKSYGTVQKLFKHYIPQNKNETGGYYIEQHR